MNLDLAFCKNPHMIDTPGLIHLIEICFTLKRNRLNNLRKIFSQANWRIMSLVFYGLVGEVEDSLIQKYKVFNVTYVSITRKQLKSKIISTLCIFTALSWFISGIYLTFTLSILSESITLNSKKILFAFINEIFEIQTKLWD